MLNKGTSVDMIIWFLFFNLLVWCITLIELWILNHPCIPGINPTWAWHMILLMYAFCGKASAHNVGAGFNPWVRKISWRRTWQPTPVFLPGKSHARRNLVGYSPWGHKESEDTTERLHFCTILAIFFGSVSSNKGNKWKGKQMALHQIKKVFA